MIVCGTVPPLHGAPTHELGFNMSLVSLEGFARFRAAQSGCDHEIRSIIVASEGSNVVGLYGQYNRRFLGGIEEAAR